VPRSKSSNQLSLIIAEKPVLRNAWHEESANWCLLAKGISDWHDIPSIILQTRPCGWSSICSSIVDSAALFEVFNRAAATGSGYDDGAAKAQSPVWLAGN
jgi:hypothetical protein